MHAAAAPVRHKTKHHLDQRRLADFLRELHLAAERGELVVSECASDTAYNMQRAAFHVHS
jgi:hypothetical protein